MKALLDTSKIVLATAVLSIMVSGCDKRSTTDQTQGAAGTGPSTTTTTPSGPEASPAVPAPSSSAMPDSGVASSSSSAGMPDPTMGAATGTATSPGAAVAGAASAMGTVVEDSVITTKLKTAIVADMILKDTNISVDTKTGTVMLTGSVTTDAQKDHVAKIAQALEGVKKVDNKLVVAVK